ncbi:putative glycolipid-binding domain-containing protein [Chryseobacterium rhizoplanae]|uniref:putative glycolipid-binding domain-containing protein n=1 Tax=Chryseobacterium rhizoplanae TaxID=1609531 RepID=UPI001CE25380|nr:putative glycolipid-binding domain-containing protein [Chryseobacterium rhizoplanae]UCA61628.1 putative glycolipid-binding domain-containing protein [Chryseobacterium rhizoplanae]
MKTLIWQGIAFQSLEYFSLTENDKGQVVTSKIIGCYENKIYTVDYQLTIDPDWNIQEFTIDSEINTIKNRLTGKKRQDEWEINNVISPDFKNFNFIDISLTPFTNTLPINNLKLTENDAQDIKVIYIDVLNNLVKPVTQQYTRIAPYTYHYDNLQTDFKSDILVDGNGLVVNYPQLFDKIAEI